MAPSDTYRDVRKTNKKSARQTAAAGGLMPMTIPKEVATPFPPLN